jgi:hypothetical protein
MSRKPVNFSLSFEMSRVCTENLTHRIARLARHVRCWRFLDMSSRADEVRSSG